MICKGGSRKAGGFFARHLLNGEDNERVEVKEMRGFTSETISEAFKEMSIIAAGTRVQNPFYHASMSPRVDESLTPEQWNIAVDTLEKNLGLEGHSRFIIEHEKLGRTHRHVVWNRIDPDTMTATPDSWNYLAHTKTQEELAQLFDHEPTPPPPERGTRIRDWENFRAAESGIDPKEVKEEVTALWKHSDSGAAFQAALEEAGYALCRGDRRDFCLVDSAGDVHSLTRRVEGVRAADIRARLADIDPQNLMTVQQASAWMKAQDAAESGDTTAARVLPPEQELIRQGNLTTNPKLTVLEKLVQEPPAHTPIDPRAAWFAENLPETYPAAATLSDHAATIEHEMRANDCELPLTQGRTWEMWADHAIQYFRERAGGLSEQVQDATRELADKLDHVKDRLSTFWQDFIKEGREREPPEIQEPELER